ncbi:MAG TPA: penicillin-insensitive murein endopeptidase [Gaiellaceae bacterium]|nr:penicillin-insensitive murein endopeptidase [Gaiellaceae bacterium]
MTPARFAAAAGILAAVFALGALVAAATGRDEAPRAAGDRRPTTEATTTQAATARATTTDAAPSPAAMRTWHAPGRGVSVTFPEHWTLATEGVGFANPGFCFQLSTEPRSRVVDLDESGAEPGGVEIRVVESFGGRRGARTRPAALRLADAAAAGIAEWTSGATLAWREYGRWMSVGVALGRGVGSDAVAEVERVLNSVRIARSGRCLAPASIAWRKSTPLGLPSSGRLVGGVQVPEQGAHFFTWDPVLRRAPNRPWRRWGTDGLVRITLRVVNGFARAHPNASRVGIGDLSRPRGGYFGPKHATHENGLDVDVYYPRLDRLERPPRSASQVDRRLAQNLVDRFVAAGASRVYVGPNVGLTGPAGIVRVIPNHDNHLHARIPRRLA